MSSKKRAASKNDSSSSSSSKRKREEEEEEGENDSKQETPHISDESTKLPPASSALDDTAAADQESSSSYSSEEDDDDDLILEGVVVRNPEVSSSSDDDDDDEGVDVENDQQDDDDERKPASKPSTAAAAASTSNNKSNNKTKASKKKRKKSKDSDDDDDLQVEFTFCDMDEKYFHGVKTLLHASSTIYAASSSALTDLMIEHLSVGTVISTEGDDEGNVFGFASVLNVTATSSSPAIQQLKDVCLTACPTQHQAEMETVLSGKTKRPAGFLLHGRMINLPLEIVLVLHQQLVMDMDWAVEHAEGGEDERKSLDFGAFVRLAPCTSAGGGGGGASSLLYKYFDDEILASHAEFTYTVDAPKAYGMEEKQLCQVIVITKTGHRDAIQELVQMIEQR